MFVGLLGLNQGCGAGPQKVAQIPPALSTASSQTLTVSPDDDLREIAVIAKLDVTAGQSPLRLWLHKDAIVESTTIIIDGMAGPDSRTKPEGTNVERRLLNEGRTDRPGASPWELDLPGNGTLRIEYTLTIPAGGHSVMRSWQGDGYLFLSAADAWYPRVEEAEPLTDLTVALPSGLSAVAPGARESISTGNQQGVRFSGYQDRHGVTVAAGPWEHHSLDGVIPIHTLLTEAHSELAADYTASIDEGLAYFQGWLGAYPFSSFSVAEMPLGNAYAFPGFTLMDNREIASSRSIHTTVHHELLHAWFGYHVSLGEGGNWVEGLVTYLVEHEYAAQRNQQEAASLRKKLLREHVVERVGGHDLPLRLVSRTSIDASAPVGYAKGAMIFHMLRRRLGDAAFYEGLREIVAIGNNYPVAWEDLLLKWEAASGERLSGFSAAWLERTGGPRLSLDGARDLGPAGEASGVTAPHKLWLALEQSEDLYRLELPVAVQLANGEVFYTTVEVPDWERAEVVVDVPAEPRVVRIDPAYEIFRILNEDEIEPTLLQVQSAGGGIAVYNAGEDFQAAVELSLATGLARWFTLVDEPDVARVHVLPAAAIAEVKKWPLPWAMGFVDGFIGLEGESLKGYSVAWAFKTGDDIQAAVVVDPEHDPMRVLSLVQHLSDWSYVLWKDGRARVGLWRSKDNSVAREVEPVTGEGGAMETEDSQGAEDPEGASAGE